MGALHGHARQVLISLYNIGTVHFPTFIYATTILRLQACLVRNSTWFWTFLQYVAVSWTHSKFSYSYKASRFNWTKLPASYTMSDDLSEDLP